MVLFAVTALAAPRVEPRRLEGALVLDGVLDEAAWQDATPITDFVQYEPGTGEPHAGASARLLYDDEALYVGFELDTGERSLVGHVVPRDETLFHDWVGVLLDTFSDGQRAFAFRANPRGVQADGVFSDGSHIWMQSLAWDGVYQAEGRVTDTGYSVELAIPLRSLRYPPDSPDWGLVLVHFVPQPWAIYTWPELSKDESSVLPQAADLGPLDLPPPGLQAELLPTLTGFYDADGVTVDPGLGAKVGLSSSLTLDLTVNPDFSQIEADALQVTANVKGPLFFQEKRPFFLESNDLFETRADVLYTRSVVDPIAGYKLTGRVDSVGVGVLGAWDQAPAASTVTYDFAKGEELARWDEELVEDKTASVHVVRLRKDVGGGASVGVSALDKQLFGGGQRYGNQVGSMDVLVPVGRVKIAGQALLSETETPDGLLAGPAWLLSMVRTGERLEASVEHSFFSPDFRAESGYVTEVGRAEQGGRLGLRFTDLGPLRFLGPALFGDVALDLDGRVVDGEVGPNVETLFGESGYANVSAAIGTETFRERAFQLWGTEGYVGFAPTSWSGLGVMWGVGTSPYYDFSVDVDELYAGLFVSPGVEAGVTIAQRVGLSYNGLVSQFYDPAGELVYETVLHRPQLSVNLTRELSVRVIEDWSSYDQVLASSALLAWQRNYGTAAYLGYTGARDPDVTEHTVFAKLSVLWRP